MLCALPPPSGEIGGGRRPFGLTNAACRPVSLKSSHMVPLACAGESSSESESSLKEAPTGNMKRSSSSRSGEREETADKKNKTDTEDKDARYILYIYENLEQYKS